MKKIVIKTPKRTPGRPRKFGVTPEKVNLSWCPLHFKKHALTSGLCTDPDCVGKIITTYTKSWKVIGIYWKRIMAAEIQRDFCVFVVEQLLREEKIHGKKPTLNPKWLIFKMKSYLYKGARDSDAPAHKIPKFAKTKIMEGTRFYEDLRVKYDEQGTGDVLEGLMNDGFDCMGGDLIPNPEQAYLFTELRQFICDKYGEPYFLFAQGIINHSDLAKLTNLRIKDVINLWEKIRKEIQKEYFNMPYDKIK